MTLTQMEYLIAVDNHRNFAEAAKSCFVTQPTLSMQIKKVEEELNVLIFDRGKKPVLTTDLGRQIIQQARVTVQESYRIAEIIESQHGEIKGELKIGIIPTICSYLLPLFVPKFMQRYPNVNIIVEEMFSEQIIAKLNNDLLDLAILATPLEEPSIVEVPLYYEKFVLYVSDRHPLYKKDFIDIHDLDLSDVWLLKEGNCFRTQVINICSERNNHKRHQLRFESGNLETIKKIVDRHFGITILPELAILDFGENEKKHIRRFIDPEPVREVSLVMRRNFMKKGLIDLLHKSILEDVPKEIGLNTNQNIISWRT